MNKLILTLLSLYAIVPVLAQSVKFAGKNSGFINLADHSRKLIGLPGQGLLVCLGLNQGKGWFRFFPVDTYWVVRARGNRHFKVQPGSLGGFWSQAFGEFVKGFFPLDGLPDYQLAKGKGPSWKAWTGVF